MQTWSQVTLVANGPFPTIKADPTPIPRPGNDFVVTVPSAFYGEENFDPQPILQANHSTVLSYAVGQQIAQAFASGQLQSNQ